MDSSDPDKQALKAMLAEGDPRFWQRLFDCTSHAVSFDELISLATLRKKALAKGMELQELPLQKLRLAMLGGCTFYPFSELLIQLFLAERFEVEIFSGGYDNYVFEITDASSGLLDFKPDVVIFLPPPGRYKYSGKLSDADELAEEEIGANTSFLLGLCQQIHERFSAEVVLCNFPLPCHHDPGNLRTRKLTSEWNSLKSLNLQLGLAAPACVHICDLEFLAARQGGLQVRDSRSWFESKQPFAFDFMCAVAGEIVRIITNLKAPPRKVLVMDLDNTLWGGSIGEDGLQGIEIGEGSPRAQCFKEFQHYVRGLKDRGVLLAVCSKNDHQTALEAFESHPEMVLRLEDIASFQANWNPKSDNILAIAGELGLSADSFVFIDDNPAEIELVRQFVPEVATILLPDDPSRYTEVLQDSRFFEAAKITREDELRAQQYASEKERRELKQTHADMDSYLASLQMEAQICEFCEIDVSRIAQLINRSNQFNLTSRRLSESEVRSLVGSNNLCLSVRLQDRFCDLGLVAVLIAVPCGSDEFVIDTFLMSCRVLQRQVEHITINALMQRACERGIRRVVGQYIPSQKNQMVRDLYERLGFAWLGADNDCARYEHRPSAFQPFSTKIRSSYDQG
jgi:FkbH-like protein